jgi:hypothetical protein
LEQEHMILAIDKWPDVAEIYQTGDDETTRRLLLVVQRRNSRPLQHELLTLLQEFENVGIAVRIRVGTVDITLEQFEKGGIYKAQPTRSVEGTQSHYNARSQLKKMESLLEQIDQNDPRYIAIAKRVRHYREMLATVDVPIEEDKLLTSDKALDRLLQLIGTEDNSDESVLKMAWNTIQPDSDLWRKKLELHRKKGDIPNATLKPASTGESTNKANEGDGDAVDSVGKGRSDATQR